jgi:hypothetical protein
MSTDPTTTPASDPLQMLDTAAAAAESLASDAYQEATTAGQHAAQAWLVVATLQIRAVLPTAHKLIVSTASWVDQRGANRPTVLKVLDRDSLVVYDCYDDSDAHDVVNEACTSLDHALRYADPWSIESGWEALGSAYGPEYEVELPELVPDLEAACQQLTGAESGVR